MSQLQSMTIDELLEEFDFLDDWEDRCEYLIDLGMELSRLPDDEKIEANRVHGCQSNVWMIIDVGADGEPTVDLRADSDAMIVRGLIVVLLTIFSGRSAREILSTNVKGIFNRLGLDRHLSTTRRNGLYSMVKRIHGVARQLGETG